jgi:hypothetical protein
MIAAETINRRGAQRLRRVEIKPPLNAFTAGGGPKLDHFSRLDQEELTINPAIKLNP